MPRFAEESKTPMSNPAKVLLAYMRLSGQWDSRALAAEFDVPLRTIQRWKMECAASATDANGAISGVPLVHEHSATRATDATDGAPQAPDMALARDLQRAQANMESPTEISICRKKQQQQQQQQPRASANDVHDAVVAAAGEALNPVSIGLHVVSDVIGWMQDGADLQLDIVPTIQAVSRGKRHSVNSWRFYAGAVAQAKAARLRGLPAAVMPGNVVTFRPQTDTSGRPLPSVSEVLARIVAEEAAHAAG
jgi:hypothetical protein